MQKSLGHSVGSFTPSLGHSVGSFTHNSQPPWTLGSYIQHGTWAGRRNFTPPARTEGVVSVAVRRGKLKVVTPERSKGVAQEAMKKLLFQVKVDRKLGLSGQLRQLRKITELTIRCACYELASSGCFALGFSLHDS